MLKQIIINDEKYDIKWTPFDVCQFLLNRSIKAEQLIQQNKTATHKLIREFYLLACRAALSEPIKKSREAEVLRCYARTIKQIIDAYDKLRGRKITLKDIDINEENDSSINSIDRLQARLFYLITQYSINPCVHIANHIVQQLTYLCHHPHIELLPAQYHAYCQSINYWRSRLLNAESINLKQNLH